jgi:hypothetical protein
MRREQYEECVKMSDSCEGPIRASTAEKWTVAAVARTFFLRWCLKPPRRYIKHSPLEGIELPKPKRRRRILDDNELKVAWQAELKPGELTKDVWAETLFPGNPYLAEFPGDRAPAEYQAFAVEFPALVFWAQ